MARRPLVLGVLLWLAVVAVVSGATWAVIDAAGRDVTARPASDPAAVGVPASTAAPDPPPASPSADRTTRALRPKPRPQRRPSPTRAPSSAAAVPTTPAPAPTTAAPVAPTTRAPAPRPSTRAPAPAPEPVERTWAGRAGSVTARCTGARIALVTATPADGWRMEVDDRGPSRVRVELHAAGAERESEESVEVRAECGGGVPRFRVDG